MDKYNYRYKFEEVQEIFKNHGYIPLFNEYKTNKVKLLCQFKENGYKGFICLNSLLCGQSIAWFHYTNPYTIDNIKQYIINNKIDCELLTSQWVSSVDKLLFKCKRCGNEFEMCWAEFGKGRTKSCYNCFVNESVEKKRNDIDVVKQAFIDRGYTPLFDDYKENKQGLLVKDSLGYKGIISYHAFQQNNGFDKFHPQNPYTIENIKHYININNIKCSYKFGEYKNNNSLLTFECECGEYFTTSWVVFSHLNKTRCDICSKKKSIMELKIQKWLDKNNINYNEQYRFDECKNKNTLPFDFAIIKNNTYILLEAQGIQHYEPIEHFGGVEAFNYRTQNDEIKRKYCKENNITLIEIPYWEIKNKNYINILKEKILS